MRWLVLSGLVLWVGATLVLAELRWFSRPPLTDRLRAYSGGGLGGAGRGGLLSVESFCDVVAPWHAAWGSGRHGCPG